jgi:hypothetical protein
MNITVKKVKHYPSMSQETLCFEANIYINGKSAGGVSNRGYGGCNSYDNHTTEATLNAYAKTLPQFASVVTDPTTNLPMMLSQDADMLISDLVNRWLSARDLKRALKKKIVFVSDHNRLMELTPMTPANLARLSGKQVLNTMPFDDALALYLSMA